MSIRKTLTTTARWIFLLLFIQAAGPGSLPPGDEVERVRAFTRTIEFDYVTWTLDALEAKFGQLALGITDYVDASDQRQIVLDSAQTHLQKRFPELLQGRLQTLSNNLAKFGVPVLPIHTVESVALQIRKILAYQPGKQPMAGKVAVRGTR